MDGRAGPASRWRTGTQRQPPAGAANRVREAQAAARATLRLSLGFLLAAAVVAAVPHPGGRWLPLHLFFAGGAGLAISATTVLFTVTWSVAPAPPRSLTALQRWSVALGAAGVTVARAWSWPSAVLAASAAVFAAGLLLLGFVLVVTVRRGVERRYDVPVAWYVAALAAGIVAIVLGALVGTGHGGAGARRAHVALNLLGLVGLVLGGTVPSFAATVGRSRMWPGATPARHRLLLAWQVGSLAAVATGFVLGHDALAAAGLAAQATGVVGVVALAPRLGRRQLTWAGPRLVALHAGLAWWAAALLAAAVRTADGGDGLSGWVLLVLAVGGLAQILWGSLCYLLPVLRGGGHERLARGFATTRSWSALAAVNLSAMAFATGLTAVAAVTLVWFAGEALVRLALVARFRGAGAG